MRVWVTLVLVVGLLCTILYYTSGTFRFAVHNPKAFYACLRSDAPIEECAKDRSGVVDSAASALHEGGERVIREVEKLR